MIRMKKLLFIGNITKRITNVAIPSIEACQLLGYDFHMAGNLSAFKDDETRYNVKLHHIDLVRNPLSLKNARAYKQMYSLLKEENFDVIHCNTPIGGMLGRICGKLAKTPKIIYTAHGFHFYKGAPLINRSIFKWAEMWMASYTDVLLTINKEDFKTAKNFKLRNNGSVYYIPGVGVNLNGYQSYRNKEDLRNSLGLSKDDVIVIAMGDLILRKNYSTSIKAIAKVANKRVHFLICGEGEELSRLQALAKELNVENQIHFLGFRSDVKDLLSIADIFLFSTHQEGLPRSMMEAMASGLPCIASNIRGNTDLIQSGKGGYLVDSIDVAGFAEYIQLLSDDSAKRSEMGKVNLNTIKKFDVENIKDEMKKIYSKELV